MNQYPLIIINKIYWYIWKLKQKDLCSEYKQRIQIYRYNIYYCVCQVSECSCYFRGIKLDEKYYSYRYFPRKNYSDQYIYDISEKKQIALLPLNY